MSKTKINLLSGVLVSLILSTSALSQSEELIVNEIKTSLPAVTDIKDRLLLRSFLSANLTKLSPETILLLDKITAPDISTIGTVTFPGRPSILLEDNLQED